MISVAPDPLHPILLFSSHQKHRVPLNPKTSPGKYMGLIIMFCQFYQIYFFHNQGETWASGGWIFLLMRVEKSPNELIARAE
jgi:hypothetical protein